MEVYQLFMKRKNETRTWSQAWRAPFGGSAFRVDFSEAVSFWLERLVFRGPNIPPWTTVELGTTARRGWVEVAPT